MKLLELTADFLGKALPVIATGVGWTVCTACFLLSIVSSILSIAGHFLGVCAP